MMNNIEKIQDDIINDFSQFDDWFETYEYIIHRGKQKHFEDKTLRSEDFSLGGCQSTVWLKAEIKDDKMHFTGDSDSLIIKGILSLILDVVNDQDPNDIIRSDLYFLDEIGLRSNLSPTRVNGLNAIINEIKTKAKDYCH